LQVSGAISPLPEAFGLCFPYAFSPFALCCPCSCPLQAVFPPHWALQGPGPPLLCCLLVGSDCGKVSLGFRSCEPHGRTSTPSVPGLGPGLQALAEQGAFAEGWSVRNTFHMVSLWAPSTRCSGWVSAGFTHLLFFFKAIATLPITSHMELQDVPRQSRPAVVEFGEGAGAPSPSLASNHWSSA